MIGQDNYIDFSTQKYVEDLLRFSFPESKVVDIVPYFQVLTNNIVPTPGTLYYCKIGGNAIVPIAPLLDGLPSPSSVVISSNGDKMYTPATMSDFILFAGLDVHNNTIISGYRITMDSSIKDVNATLVIPYITPPPPVAYFIDSASLSYKPSLTSTALNAFDLEITSHWGGVFDDHMGLNWSCNGTEWSNYITAVDAAAGTVVRSVTGVIGANTILSVYTADSSTNVPSGHVFTFPINGISGPFLFVSAVNNGFALGMTFDILRPCSFVIHFQDDYTGNIYIPDQRFDFLNLADMGLNKTVSFNFPNNTPPANFYASLVVIEKSFSFDVIHFSL